MHTPLSGTHTLMTRGQLITDVNDEKVYLDTRRLGGGNLNRLKINILQMWPRRKYTAVLAAQESKLQEFTADLQNGSGRKKDC